MCQVMESSKAFSSGNLDRRPFSGRKPLIGSVLFWPDSPTKPPGHSTLTQFALGDGSDKDSLIVDYVSTRGAAPTLGFADALLAGLARDGGLYLPLSLPHLPPDAIRGLRGIPYPEATARLMAPFIGDDFDHAEMKSLTAAAYSSFRHAATAPLTQVDDNLFALELFHGPTL